MVLPTFFRPKTGFQLWLEENRKGILADNPELDETDVIKEAMGRFRALSAEDRLVRHSAGSTFVIILYTIIKCDVLVLLCIKSSLFWDRALILFLCEHMQGRLARLVLMPKG